MSERSALDSLACLLLLCSLCYRFSNLAPFDSFSFTPSKLIHLLDQKKPNSLLLIRHLHLPEVLAPTWEQPYRLRKYEPTFSFPIHLARSLRSWHLHRLPYCHSLTLLCHHSRQALSFSSQFFPWAAFLHLSSSCLNLNCFPNSITSTSLRILPPPLLLSTIVTMIFSKDSQTTSPLPVSFFNCVQEVFHFLP